MNLLNLRLWGFFWIYDMRECHIVALFIFAAGTHTSDQPGLAPQLAHPIGRQLRAYESFDWDSVCRLTVANIFIRVFFHLGLVRQHV